MREEEEAARLDIATESLKFIRHVRQPVTRNEFFVSESSKISPQHIRAMSSRSWQKTFTQRLVDYRFLRPVKHGDTIKYEIYSDGADAFLYLCILNRDYYNGLLISQLVFESLPQGAFIKKCMQCFSEMKAEDFKSIDNEKDRQTMLNQFPDLEQIFSAPDSKSTGNIAPRMRLAAGVGNPSAQLAIADLNASNTQQHGDDVPSNEDEEIKEIDFGELPPDVQEHLAALESTGQKQFQVLAGIAKLLQQLVRDHRDSRKRSEELVKSLQGLLRQHAGQSDISTKLSELEIHANTTTTALKELAGNVKTVSDAIISLAESLDAAQDNKLDMAAKAMQEAMADVRAASALFVDAIAERQK